MSTPNNPNSYINHIRDNGFVDRYSVDRREMPQYRYPARQRGRGATRRRRPHWRQGPMLPLSSFYNAQNKLEWPGDAPTEGDLKAKREVFDKACDVVLAETKKNGVAAMASVTELGRNCSITAGRRWRTSARTTRRGSPTRFHMFMLSLYESLAQAANPAHRACRAAAGNPLRRGLSAVGAPIRARVRVRRRCRGFSGQVEVDDVAVAADQDVGRDFGDAVGCRVILSTGAVDQVGPANVVFEQESLDIGHDASRASDHPSEAGRR